MFVGSIGKKFDFSLFISKKKRHARVLTGMA